MKYAKILPKGVLISDRYFDGAKPLNDQMPQAPDGMVAVPDGWEETDTGIIRKWRLDPAPEPEAEPADYEAALNRLWVDV